MELDSNLPWIEKYRPKSVEEISSQEEVVQVLKKSLNSKNLPHLLFYGPPGTGKTSSILALSRELYGPELYKSRVLELNASDERGIQVIRERIKNFAKITVGSGSNQMNDPSLDYPSPPFKIIILDEADSLTKDAQAALRRTMETYSKTTRFCIICNYITRIIEPLSSRCAKFRFKSIPRTLYNERIQYISELEKLPIEASAIERLSELTEGDLRKGIMYLQSAQRFAKINSKVTVADIEQLVGVVPTPTVEACVSLILSKNIYQLTNWLNDFLMDGYPGYQLLIQLHDTLVSHPELSSIHKSHISILMGKVDRYLTEGAGDHLQILQLLIGIVNTINTQ